MHPCLTIQPSISPDLDLITVRRPQRIMEDSTLALDISRQEMQSFLVKENDSRTMTCVDLWQSLDPASIKTFQSRFGGITEPLLLVLLKELNFLTPRRRVRAFIMLIHFRNAWTRCLSCSERVRLLRAKRLSAYRRKESWISNEVKRLLNTRSLWRVGRQNGHIMIILRI